MIPELSSTKDDDKLIQPLQREATLSNRVAAKLEEILLENHFQVGDRLPPERELARQFNVSRTVVRGAVRALTAKGLLEVHMGSGTVVTSPTTGDVAQSLKNLLRIGELDPGYSKVLEVRRILEVEIAGLAAMRRTEQDIESLRTILDEYSIEIVDRDLFAEIDYDFHSAVVIASHNEIFTVLLNSISELLFEIRYKAFDVPGTAERAWKHHRAIFDQICAGDRDKAQQAMLDHIIEAEETMQKARNLHIE